VSTPSFASHVFSHAIPASVVPRAAGACAPTACSSAFGQQVVAGQPHVGEQIGQRLGVVRPNGSHRRHVVRRRADLAFADPNAAGDQRAPRSGGRVARRARRGERQLHRIGSGGERTDHVDLVRPLSRTRTAIERRSAARRAGRRRHHDAERQLARRAGSRAAHRRTPRAHGGRDRVARLRARRQGDRHAVVGIAQRGDGCGVIPRHVVDRPTRQVLQRIGRIGDDVALDLVDRLRPQRRGQRRRAMNVATSLGSVPRPKPAS
jgi:hypothetical protein